MVAPDAASTRAERDPYAALRLPAFRWFVGSLAAMTLGAQLQGLVVAWQVYELTKRPEALGFIGAAEVIPYIGAALWAGRLADRANRRRIALIALAVLACTSATLLALTASGAVATPTGVGFIYATIAVSGLARSFLQPARQGVGVEIVPRALYPNAVTWRTSVWQTSAVLGPATGGLIYGFGGAALAYAIDVGLLIVAFLAFTRVAYAPVARAPSPDAESMWESLTSGVRYVTRQPVLAGAMTLDMLAVFFGGATALLPIFADEILLVGPQGLGLLRAAPAVGAVTMSLVLAYRPPMRRAGRALFTSVALFGVCMIAFALSRDFWLSLALLAASGAVDMVSVVVRSTLLQSWTPVELIGRVSSVNAIFVGSSNEIGMLESGFAASLMGTVPSVIFGGAMTLVVVSITAWRVPVLRRLGSLVPAT